MVYDVDREVVRDALREWVDLLEIIQPEGRYSWPQCWFCREHIATPSDHDQHCPDRVCGPVAVKERTESIMQQLNSDDRPRRHRTILGDDPEPTEKYTPTQ